MTMAPRPRRLAPRPGRGPTIGERPAPGPAEPPLRRPAPRVQTSTTASRAARRAARRRRDRTDEAAPAARSLRASPRAAHAPSDLETRWTPREIPHCTAPWPPLDPPIHYLQARSPFKTARLDNPRQQPLAQGRIAIRSSRAYRRIPNRSAAPQRRRSVHPSPRLRRGSAHGATSSAIARCFPAGLCKGATRTRATFRRGAGLRGCAQAQAHAHSTLGPTQPKRRQASLHPRTKPNNPGSPGLP
jgi:hypothetical protein